MAGVWLAQCLCPQDHAILAISAEMEDALAAESLATQVRQNVASFLADRVFNPWCGICRAPPSTWRYEVVRTRFASMWEARPVLQIMEEEQANFPDELFNYSTTRRPER